jgi:hypothetical protein
MKYLVIFLILTGILSVMIPTTAYGLCLINSDWPDAPCWGRRCGDSNEPACIDPNWWKERWAPYYDYKGKEWMDAKKQELMHAIESNTLTEWKSLTPNGTNRNVHDYYFYMGEAPSIYGVYVDQFFAGSFPPLKQLKAGAKPDELFCKDNFVLIHKYNGSPACVKPETKEKLIIRGWTIPEPEPDRLRHGYTPAFEYHRVQINGTTATKICTILGVPCTTNPVFDAINRHDKNYTYFHYNLQDEEYLFVIDDGQICYTTDDVNFEYTGLFEKCIEEDEN